MEIIVSHELTDLDGLAAMVAAKKLYNDAKLVFPGRLHRLVKNFMALYRDEIQVYELKDIDIQKIKRLIIVDTCDRNRLGTLESKLDWNEVEVIVYDHHPHNPKGWVDLDLSEDVSSATTILIKRIKANNIQLTPMEATICALGIYADTGNFTHLDTTADDVDALAYLLEAKANLKIINEFLVDELNTKQKEIYELLLDNRDDIKINNINIPIFCVKQKKYVSGLNSVCENIKSFLNLTVVFILVKTDKKVIIIGRSSDEAVNIGKICKQLGGGGHAGAGSATLRTDLTLAKQELKNILNQEVKSYKKVKEIMTPSVKTISPDTSIAEVEKILEKYGHGGLVITENDEVKGIFSRRDLKKVKGHDLMHAPVKGYMSKNVITVKKEASINKARDLMVKYNIGRLPVVKNNKLIGIVTRSDILSSYYDKKTPYKYQNKYGSSLIEIKSQKFDICDQLSFFKEEIKDILKMIGKLCATKDRKIYLVGGMVRDLLLKKNNKDLDFVTEGNLKDLLPLISEEIKGEYEYNEQFQTASIQLESGYNLDIALTRKEFYSIPGALPEIEKTNILEDLFRRDYTINALALDLSPDDWGTLIDFFEGRKDIEKKLLRVIHHFSFLDDPTRIIRGIRLAVALDFNVERETKRLMKEALSMGKFSQLSSSRLFNSLQKLLKQKCNNRFINLIKELNILNLIDENAKITDKIIKELKNAENHLAYFTENNYNVKKWLIRMAILTQEISPENFKEWNLTSFEMEILNSYSEINPEIVEDKPVNIHKMVKNFSSEKIILVLTKIKNKQFKQKVKNHLENFSDIQLNIDGNDLQELGLNPGPEIKEILDKILLARIKGKINNNKDEELEYAKNLISKRK